MESLHSSGSFFGSLLNLHKVFGSCKNQVEQQTLTYFHSCPEELCDTAFMRNPQVGAPLSSFMLFGLSLVNSRGRRACRSKGYGEKKKPPSKRRVRVKSFVGVRS